MFILEKEKILQRKNEYIGEILHDYKQKPAIHKKHGRICNIKIWGEIGSSQDEQKKSTARSDENKRGILVTVVRDDRKCDIEIQKYMGISKDTLQNLKVLRNRKVSFRNKENCEELLCHIYPPV